MFPKTELGIFVIIVDASIFTNTEGDVDGSTVSVKLGTVKVLAFQSSKKKPMVLAIAGSVGLGSV